MTPETAAYLNSLPKPDDVEGWRKREQAMLALVLDTFEAIERNFPDLPPHPKDSE